MPLKNLTFSNQLTKNFLDIITKKEIEQRKNFIKEQKVNYINSFMNKINTNLTRRRLKPIFNIRRREENIPPPALNSMINVKRFKSTVLNQIIFKPNNNSMINFENVTNSKNKNNNENIEKNNDNDEEEKEEESEDELDKIEEKQYINEIDSDKKNNKIGKSDLSYKSTESKVTLFQNDSKSSS